MNIHIEYPNEELLGQLQEKIAVIKAELIFLYINKLNISSEMKKKILEEIINTLKSKSSSDLF